MTLSHKIARARARIAGARVIYTGNPWKALEILCEIAQESPGQWKRVELKVEAAKEAGDYKTACAEAGNAAKAVIRDWLFVRSEGYWCSDDE